MNIEKEILVSILKLTKNGSASIELIARTSKIPVSIAENHIVKISNLNLASKIGDIVKVDSIQRLKIALKAISLGADIERVCRNLSWEEFEEVVIKALQVNGYSTVKHFRFRHGDKMREIDILAVKGRIIICADCKRWMKRLTASMLDKIVNAQMERVKMLSEIFPSIRGKMELQLNGKVFLVPLILSLIPSPFKFWNGTPIVPVLQLQNFLDELPAQLRSLNYVKVDLDSFSAEYV